MRAGRQTPQWAGRLIARSLDVNRASPGATACRHARHLVPRSRENRAPGAVSTLTCGNDPARRRRGGQRGTVALVRAQALDDASQLGSELAPTVKLLLVDHARDPRWDPDGAGRRGADLRRVLGG